MRKWIETTGRSEMPVVKFHHVRFRVADAGTLTGNDGIIRSDAIHVHLIVFLKRKRVVIVFQKYGAFFHRFFYYIFCRRSDFIHVFEFRIVVQTAVAAVSGADRRLYPEISVYGAFVREQYRPADGHDSENNQSNMQ